MPKILLLTLAILFCVNTKSAFAQQYITAAGLRISNNHIGLSLQQRLLPKTTVEAIAALNLRGVRATVLLEKHFPLATDNLNFYAGGGLHTGYDLSAGRYAGADGIAGIEFKLPAAKWLVSLDINPALHFGYTRVVDMRTAISVRKILVGEPVFKNKALKNLFKKNKKRRQ